MPRRLTGYVEVRRFGVFASIPAARGSRARIGHTFTSQRAAQVWLDAAIAAREAGRTVPEPTAGLAERSGSAPRRRGPVAAPAPQPPAPSVCTASTVRSPDDPTSFRGWGTLYVAEHFDALRRAGGDRKTAVERNVELMADWIEARGLPIQGLGRHLVLDMLLSFARAPEPDHAPVPDGLDPAALVSLADAAALPGVPSRSTIRRAVDAGRIPEHRVGARVYYRVSDLYALTRGARSGPGPRRTYGYARDVLSDIRSTFETVMAYAADHGVAVPQDRSSLENPITDRPPAPTRQPIALADIARLAGQLHVVHQVALWLMRILGLRISEAFGVRVCDVIDLGPGEPGLLRVHRQGGRILQERNAATGKFEPSPSVNRVKTATSERWLVVPVPLMELLRAIIDVFHTSPDGLVREQARLIPGLAAADVSGQASFRAALRRAALVCRVTVIVPDGELDEDVIRLSPHNLRASVISDLERCREIADLGRRRFAGHAAGADVHSRAYLWDDPQLREQRDVAAATQAMIEDEVPMGLLVETRIRCTTGAQPHLAGDAARIDAELAELGWLVRATVAGEVLLTPAEVARECEASVQSVRRWTMSGELPSQVIAVRANGEVRGVHWSDLQDFIATRERILTLTDLATELGVAYSRLYQYVRTQRFPTEETVRGGVALTPAHEADVRQHFAREDALIARSIPICEAVSDLGVSHAIVLEYIKQGSLVEDEPAHNGRRMVTRASVTLTKSVRERRRSGAARPQRR